MPNLTKRRVSEAQDLEKSYRLADIVKQRKKTLAALKLKAGELVLDIGCGGGNLCVDLAKEGYKVKGVDESSEMIKIAKRSVEKLNFNYDISFDKLSLQNIRDDKAEYDVITSMGVIGYLDNDDILFDIASRKLYKGGKFIVSCRNRLFNLFPGSKYLKKEIKTKPN